jgi:hypothetical protein
LGRRISSLGEIYEGEWRADKEHGHGTETFEDGSKYTGEYQFGMKNGHGKFLGADQSRYEGEFVNNKR